MSQFSQTSRVLKPHRRHGRPSSAYGRAQTFTSRVDEGVAAAVALGEGRFQRIAQPLVRDAAGLEPVDDHVERTVGRRVRRAAISGSGSVERSTRRSPATTRRKPSSLSDAANSSRSTPSATASGKATRYRVPGGSAASARAALWGESRRTSSPHFWQNTRPILANNSRR